VNLALHPHHPIFLSIQPKPCAISLPEAPLAGYLEIQLSSLVLYSCSLFVAPKNLNSFVIKQIQALFRKHRGAIPLPAPANTRR
jgi:hypothetical protein